MKTNTPTQRRRSGFTLIEMIGVLAIIAVLAALLIPRIFTAINESRVNGAALSYNSVKSAAMSYFGKHGRFGSDATGTAYTSTEISNSIATPINWGGVLLSTGFTEKPFETKIGTANTVELTAANVASAAAITGVNAGYDLDGTGGNDVTGQLVIQAVITGVAEDDARELSRKIDGTGNLSTASGDDFVGRVKYAAAVDGVTNVRIYIAHK